MLYLDRKFLEKWSKDESILSDESMRLSMNSIADHISGIYGI